MTVHSQFIIPLKFQCSFILFYNTFTLVFVSAILSGLGPVMFASTKLFVKFVLITKCDFGLCVFKFHNLASPFTGQSSLLLVNAFC